MGNPRILIVGSGNTTGINVIKSLYNDYEVYGTDCKRLNAANKFCENIVVPHASDPDYERVLLDYACQKKISHIISSNDHDTRTLFKMHAVLESMGIHHNGYCCHALELLDKSSTEKLFQYFKILTPQKITVPHIPFVLRKREMGNSSKFLYIAKSEEDLGKIPEVAFSDGILTEYIEGVEYTIDVLCDNDGEALCVIPRERMEVHDGMVWHGRVVRDMVLISTVRSICKKLHLKGVMCLQCIKNAEGKYYFIEVNPRTGSGIDLSVNAGCNLPVLWVQLTQGELKHIPEPSWDTEMIRYNTAYYFHASSGSSI